MNYGLGAVLYFFWDGFGGETPSAATPTEFWQLGARPSFWRLAARPNVWTLTRQ